MSLDMLGDNSFVGANNVFIYNGIDATMYNTLYHFTDWPFLDIDIVSYKLRYGKNIDFTKAYVWMSNWNCPTHSQPQYVMVQTTVGFRIYCNVRESIQYLRHWGFNEDIRMVRIKMSYHLFRENYENYYTDPDKYKYITSKIFNPAVDMMDNLIENSNYEFSYYPFHSSDWSDVSTSECIYIVDALSEGVEQKLMEYSKLAKATSGDALVYREEANTVYIEYLPLGKTFCENLRT